MATNSAVIPREGGESSTPRPLRNSLLSLEYWVARSSRAMTPECVARVGSDSSIPSPSGTDIAPL
ncbi:hypothetical protein EAS61_38015 [Bradyrhizobium zhanjiangense]|uniref:Uncharacterized protein n=1 Tax=Bradyrhizobium zhanjiangense TaxID=1325107 RepID=A0A4Q0Q752_9BRAD|nr:hypothetical protein EAS61_38015 [Bradyrhizobium zhanjiangense]